VLKEFRQWESTARTERDARGAVWDGIAADQRKEIVLRVSRYCGIPAGIDDFRLARATFEGHEH
jgi:hypothetical protein